MRYLAVLITALWAVGLGAKSLPERWNYTGLERDWRVSQMLDSQVYTSDGRPVGLLHDLVFDRDGKLRTLVVERGDDDAGSFFALPWGDSRFSSAVGSLTLTVPVAEVREVEHRDTPDFVDGGYEASNLMGMMVDLKGEKRWGQVADLLIPEGGDEVSAMVVEDLGVGRREYALPPRWGDVGYDEHRLSLPYEVDTVKGLGRFRRSGGRLP